jgi:hypothetical protein
LVEAAMRLSNSSINRYVTCPESYRLRYIERVVGIKKSAALFFGGAVDLGCNVLLKDRNNLWEAIATFNINWKSTKDQLGNVIDLENSLDITFSNKDFDQDLCPPDRIETFNLIAENKKLYGWDKLPSEDKLFFNRTAWLCLKAKGELMIRAYHSDIMPHLKSVIAIQKEVELSNGTGDTIIGYIDILGELNSGEIAILDTKTSADYYEEDAVSKSEQLALYKLMLNTIGKEQVVTKAGYLVLVKKLDKTVTLTCQTCGHHVVNRTLKSCDAKVDGKRCGGEWERSVELKVPTQILIGNISEEQQDKVLDIANQVSQDIHAGKFEKNEKSCFNFGRCSYYEVCHGNDFSQVVKLPEKDKKDDKRKS